MTELKLSKLPDRNPVRITIAVRPDLNAALRAYADLYRDNYGEEESVTELIPYMLQLFLESDRGFAKAMKDREGSGDHHGENSGRARQRNNIEGTTAKS